MKFFLMITSIMYWLLNFILGFPIFIFCLLIWLFTFLFDKRLVILHKCTMFWASTWVYSCPFAKVEYIGKEKLNKKDPFVIIVNHQSITDIAALAYLPLHFKFVSKSEIFWIPGPGWIMFFNRYIMLKRDQFGAGKKMLLDCERSIKEGSSVVIFPEGTRARDGKMKSFKTGAFEVALNTKVGLQPIVIYGTGKISPKGLFFQTFGDLVLVKILDQIPYDVLKDMDSHEAANFTQKIMLNELNLLQKTWNEKRKND